MARKSEIVKFGRSNAAGTRSPSSNHRDGTSRRVRVAGASDGIQCGVCLQRLPSRDFRRLYLTEIPGYPLGAPLRTFARVRICKGCWKGMLSGTVQSRARLRSLLEWTGAPAS